MTLQITGHTGAEALAMLGGVVLPVNAASYADQFGDPFFTPERFAERLHGYAAQPGFELVLARDGGEPVGMAFGYPLPASTRWWSGALPPVPESLTDEDGSRTFALTEIMVNPGYRRRGVGRRLHDALLHGRREARATLLVRPDNVPARTAYERWGWQPAVKVKPFADSPTYDALVLPLG